MSISRPNFIELCLTLTESDEQAFEALWRTLGLSVDWSMTYTTIGSVAQRISQRSFLDLLSRGEAYQLQAPTLWDVDFQTAVAQAELEDRERPGAMHRVRSVRGRRWRRRTSNGGDILIETTRPELIPACVALLAHPEDERWSALVGGEALTPLFGTRVPVLTHPLVEPDKGTGLVMVCTFGDLTDVTWWRELSLPVRAVLGRGRAPARGALGGARLGVRRPRRAHARATASSRGAASTRRAGASSSCWRESGELIGEPEPVNRAVKFFEKGERPIEIVTSRQWFFKTVAHREALLARGPSSSGTPVHARALRGLGQRAHRRLVRQPPALLRGALPALVPDRRVGRGPLRAPDRGASRAAAGRSLHRRARRLHPRAARPAGRVRGRPRRDGHVGDLLAHAPDRRHGR